MEDSHPILEQASTLLYHQQRLLYQAGLAANASAQRHTLSLYRAGVKPNTRRRHHTDLACFRTYLNTVLQETGVLLTNEQGQPLDLGDDTALPLWGSVTYGLVLGFREYLFTSGYAFATIKAALSTVKMYCTLAAQAEVMPVDELVRIKEIKSYRPSQAEELEKQREIHRRGHKKAEETLLSEEERERLFLVPDRGKPQGWRDLLLLLLLYDLGVRPGELVTATLADLDLRRGWLRVYRHKADEKEQWLELSANASLAANRYLALRQDTSPEAPLMVTTRKNGQLVELVEQPDGTSRTPGISSRKLSQRVHDLGSRIGVDINGYDPRHQWASDMVDMDNNYVQVLDAGGWAKESVVLLRYRGRKQIPNQGLKLKRKEVLALEAIQDASGEYHQE
jgi:integrase